VKGLLYFKQRSLGKRLSVRQTRGRRSRVTRRGWSVSGARYVRLQPEEGAMPELFEEGAARGQFRRRYPPGELARLAPAALEGLMILTKTHRGRMG